MNVGLHEKKLHSWEATGWFQPILYTLETELSQLKRVGRRQVEKRLDGLVFYDAPGGELILFFGETLPRFRIGHVIFDALDLNVNATVNGSLFRKISITSKGLKLFEKSYVFPFWHLLMDDGQWGEPDKFESFVKIVKSPDLQKRFTNSVSKGSGLIVLLIAKNK